jgi:hypothetical protein
MIVNQEGQEVNEEVLRWADQLDDDTTKQLILLTIQHLKLEAVRTNATKHGNTEILLRPEQ